MPSVNIINCSLLAETYKDLVNTLLRNKKLDVHSMMCNSTVLASAKGFRHKTYTGSIRTTMIEGRFELPLFRTTALT